MVAALVQGIGSTGLFASRIFIPAFIAALLLRFGDDLGLIRDVGLLSTIGVTAAPTWFTHDITLIVLGVLAALEVIATKNADARMLLAGVEQYAKPVMAFITYMGVASVLDQRFVEQTMLKEAGLLDTLPALVVAGATYVVATTRRVVVQPLIDLDADDDLGVQKLISWAEDVWSAFGMVMLILFPIVMIVLLAIVLGVLALLKRRAERREEQSKIACGACHEPMYRAALCCPACGESNPGPTQLNWLGASTDVPVTDRERHPYRLAMKKRCAHCATRLPAYRLQQPCPGCGRASFEARAFLDTYDRILAGRLPVVLLVTAALSLIPVIGLIPGIIYYRIALVAPYRQYIPRLHNMLMRWGVRLVMLVLIAVQWIPLVGVVTVPSMALLSFGVYRWTFHRQAAQIEPPLATPAAT